MGLVYNFASDVISLGDLHTKLWVSKVARVPILGISDSHDIWVLVSWPGIEYTIRGKVMASPKFGPW
jgi:hypothetical protein